jgi:ectoine hydroxylase-related dioxygenase (phytanoyl-CoA dioxygenase family)
MISTFSKNDPRWLEKTLAAIASQGVAIIDSVLDLDFIGRTKEAMYETQKKILAELGKERLDKAGELGVLRFMMKYDSFFFKYLEIPEVLEIIDKTITSTAILHTQNGFILPSFPKNQTPKVSQNQFHMDFPRIFENYLASMNIYFSIDEFTTDNGATLVVPGSHQQTLKPNPVGLMEKAIPAECSAGSIIVFDSTLWHAAGTNISGKDRLSINHQFTRSYFKQQMDYVRGLRNAIVLSEKPRVQQLLGWYTRLPSSLDEYYRPEDQRLYRKGQG